MNNNVVKTAHLHKIRTEGLHRQLDKLLIEAGRLIEAIGQVQARTGTLVTVAKQLELIGVLRDRIRLAVGEGTCDRMRNAILRQLVEVEAKDAVPVPQSRNEGRDREIVRLVKMGASQTIVAEQFGITPSRVGEIVRQERERERRGKAA